MLIEVKEIHAPPTANRSGTIVAMDGQKLDCWPPLFHTIHVGHRYEVVTTTNAKGYTSIKKATPVSDTPPSTGSAPAGLPLSDGAAYVGHVIAAKILKGDMQDKDLVAFTARLRKIWRETDPEAHGYRQAAE